MYSGHIYNNEGFPISGLAVSDGRNISITDEDGCYSLPGWERESMIFVQALTRRHDDWYKRIESGVYEYDFTVDIYEGGKSSSHLHISDTEIFVGDASAEDWLGFISDSIDRENPDFLIHTGDICRKRGLEKHHEALCSETAGIPIRYTLGNHDYVNEVYGEYTFEKYYGPIWYSFNLGDMHYIVLPITRGEAPGRYEQDDRVRWLAEDLKTLKPGQRIGVFCHTHSDGSEDSFTVKGKSERVDLREYGILLWEFGHYHINCVNRFGDAFSICTGRPDVGGIDGTPAACRLVRISEDFKLETRLIHNEAPAGECELFRYELDGNVCFSNPIAADDGIIIATFSDGYPQNSGIQKLSYDGKLLWKYETAGSVKWNMAYGDGKIYAADTAGFVYGLDSDGREIFKTALPCPDIKSLSGITLCEGKLYTASFYRFYEIDAESGTLLRATDVKKAVAACTAMPTIHGNLILWGNHWDGLYALERDNLSTLWKCDEVKDSVAQAVVCGEYIFVPTRYHLLKLTLDGEIVCKSAEYSETTFDSYAEPAVKDGKIYVPTTNMGVVAFDAVTLEEVHRFECGGSMLGVCTYTKRGMATTVGKPMIFDDTLIFTAVDGCVYFYNIYTHALVRKVQIGHPITTGVCASPRGLAVVDFDGGLSFIK